MFKIDQLQIKFREKILPNNVKCDHGEVETTAQ